MSTKDFTGEREERHISVENEIPIIKGAGTEKKTCPLHLHGSTVQPQLFPPFCRSLRHICQTDSLSGVFSGPQKEGRPFQPSEESVAH